MAKEGYYFSHDYSARSDEKIKKLIRKHGMEGYGVFWSLVEDLYQNENSLQFDTEGIAYDLRVKEHVIKSVICDFGLFSIEENKVFGSTSIERRLNERAEKSKKARDSANNRWKKNEENANAYKNNANALRGECESNAIKERKGKEKKGYKNMLLSEIKISDFSEDIKQEHFEIAISFISLFRANLEEAGASTSIVDKAKGTSIDDIRLLIETDGYNVHDCREVFTFLKKSNFWKKNILSTKKLREQFSKLKMEIKNGNKRINSTEPSTNIDELAGLINDNFNS